MSKPKVKANRPPLSPRGALLLTLSMIVAMIGGGLTYAATRSLPLAAIALGPVFAAAWSFFDKVIDTE